MTALNTVNEKMAASDLSRRLVVYFDYSSQCDVPPLLEHWQQYRLPNDLDFLVSTFVENGIKSTSEHTKAKVKLSVSKDLICKIDQAKRYMSEHPDWFHCNLHPPKNVNHSMSLPSTKTKPPVTTPSQPIDVIAVEQEVPETTSKNTSSLNLHKLSPTLNSTTSRRTGSLSLQSNYATISSLTSWSSGADDLEYDVDFMLNPTLKLQEKYFVPSKCRSKFLLKAPFQNGHVPNDRAQDDEDYFPAFFVVSSDRNRENTEILQNFLSTTTV